MTRQGETGTKRSPDDPVPAWLTVNRLPAIVIVPARGLAAGLAPTEKLTVPFPTPELAAVIVSQGALLTAVHAQPLCAVTLKLLGQPAAEAGALCKVII